MRKLRADRLDAMGGMAAALSHEINQPLTAIAAYLSAAQRLLGRSLFKAPTSWTPWIRPRSKWRARGRLSVA
ncbi:histidine kinase dimerization/phospho-acceptor domain-containing protein [Methylocystis sp. Sn-Cys]|uniref:histidine kinase dimerization/phospho-acceptor domain-containing protein n=1 Tax=Methylocystis sp. Sn-Cys TaxID=1701263 RepID=UPI001AEE3276